MVDYYCIICDGCIVFGKGIGVISYGLCIGWVFDVDWESLVLIEVDFCCIYFLLGDILLVDGWFGFIDCIYDSLLVFGYLYENIYYGIGWSGNGVGLSCLGGWIFVSFVFGCDDLWSCCLLVECCCWSFFFELLCYLGGFLVCNVVLCKECVEFVGIVFLVIDCFFVCFVFVGFEDKF